ncbi:MAG: response regulator [Thermoanaerobaculia bacterium]
MSESTAPFSISLLGGFQMTTAGGQTVTLPSRKAQVLISYLAQRSNQPVSRGKLASMLWSGTSDQEARHSLRQCLLVIRKAVGESRSVLNVRQDSITFAEGAAILDTRAFEGHAASKDEKALREAVALYRGEFLEGVSLLGEPIEEWIRFERKRLAHAMSRALGALLQVSESEGRADEAIQLATRLLAIDPQQVEVRNTLTRLYGGTPPTSILSSGRSVIVADASHENRAQWARALRAADYEVRTAEDGATLFLELGAGGVDLVILDFDFPMLGGLDALRTLRQKRPQIPVIVLATELDEELEAEALSLGAADLLRKPVAPEVLVLRIDNVTRQLARPVAGAN